MYIQIAPYPAVLMKSPTVVNITLMAMVACLFSTIVTLAVADDQEDLAKESQNPIANIDMAAKRHKKHKNITLYLIISMGYEIKIREF